jgi:hypothetical protein
MDRTSDGHKVSSVERTAISPIASEAPTETRLEALIRLEVACRLALESLPKLPAETEEALREPIETLCEVSGASLSVSSPVSLTAALGLLSFSGRARGS